MACTWIISLLGQNFKTPTSVFLRLLNNFGKLTRFCPQESYFQIDNLSILTLSTKQDLYFQYAYNVPCHCKLRAGMNPFRNLVINEVHSLTNWQWALGLRNCRREGLLCCFSEAADILYFGNWRVKTLLKVLELVDYWQ